MASIKQKWFELGQIESDKQIEYLKDVIKLYQGSPQNNGLLYAALITFTLIFMPAGYWIVFGGIFWVCFGLGIHILVYSRRVYKFKKKWGFK